MASFFYWLLDSIESVIDLIARITFNFGGTYVSLLSLILSLFIIAFVISVFWKGARK